MLHSLSGCALPPQVKFIYDHVFEPRTDNRTVYKTVASPIVQSALDGINGTVFACEGCCLVAVQHVVV